MAGKSCRNSGSIEILLEETSMKKEEKIEFRYYEIPQGFPLMALMGEKWEIPYGGESLHFHNYLEIGVCRYGEGVMHFGKKEIPYHDGTITIIPKDFLHRTSGKNNDIQKWEYLFIDAESFIRKIYENSPHLANGLLKRLQSRMFLVHR